jgi:hypothetical protein
MEVKEILEQFQFNRGRFAREAVLAAIERREEITPRLLQIVEETTSRAEELAQQKDYFAHLYAFHLLAQFRERRAYPMITKLFSLPGEVVEPLAVDFIDDGLERVLASVAHGDAGPVKELIENRSANQWARSSAIKSIVAMVALGEHPRQVAIEYFRNLLREKLEREAAEYYGPWDSLVSAAIDLYPEDLYPEIREAFQEGLVQVLLIKEDVDAVLERGKEAVLADLPRKYPLITDAVAEMEWWACFEDFDIEVQEEPEKVSPPVVEERFLGSASSPGMTFSGPDQGDRRETREVRTIVRETPKIGRNDSCTCGSGKKYKKCCGRAAP